jgi:glucosamine--fructose-6-phosphate aminotransferase (isomerizing)
MKSLGNFPDPFIAEIAGQPDALRRAASGLGDQRSILEAIALEAAGRTLVFTGMGSSYDACYPAVAELARAGVAAIMLDSAELLHFRSGMLGPSTLLVAVSQSGESVEVVRLVDRLPARPDRPMVVAITNGATNTLASSADRSLDTRAGAETGPSTMTFAASLVAVGALGRVLAGSPIDATLDRLAIDAELVAVTIESFLGEADLPDRLLSWLGDRGTVVILGRGPARAASEMAALTIKEAVGMPVESLQTAQFRHGPLELAGPELAAVVIATEPETLSLDLALTDELLASGAGVLLIATDPHPGCHAMQMTTGPLDRALAPAASIVPCQLLAWSLAGARGRKPGAYYRATKVTTHE